MKITDRDKKLLCVVGAAIIIFCAYYFGCRILINKTQEITETISTLNKEHNALAYACQCQEIHYRYRII